MNAKGNIMSKDGITLKQMMAFQDSFRTAKDAEIAKQTEEKSKAMLTEKGQAHIKTMRGETPSFYDQYPTEDDKRWIQSVANAL